MTESRKIEPLQVIGSGLFMVTFLLPNQHCQSTEEKKVQSDRIISECRYSFILFSAFAALPDGVFCAVLIASVRP